VVVDEADTIVVPEETTFWIDAAAQVGRGAGGWGKAASAGVAVPVAASAPAAPTVSNLRNRPCEGRTRSGIT
jgi:hypothetical protein